MNDYAYQNPIVREVARAIDAVGHLLLKPIRRTPGKVERIVMFRLDQIGDAFYCTPMLDYLAQKFPDVKVDVVTTSRCAPVFENHPALGEIHTFNYARFARGGRADGWDRLVALGKTLRAKKFDIAIDPRGEPLVALLGAVAGIPIRVGIAREEVLSFTYTHPVRYDPEAPAWHRFRSILAELGIEAKAWEPKMHLTSSETEEAWQRSEQIGKFIALHLGAGLPFKRWPVESFAGVARMAAGSGMRVVTIGSSDEKQLSNELSQLGVDVEDYSGKLSVRETYALLAHATAFVGNDSAPVHLAAAHGIPAVHLMSGASPTSASALGRGVVVLIGKADGHVCQMDRCTYPCPNMQSIKVEDVTNALKPVLS